MNVSKSGGADKADAAERLSAQHALLFIGAEVKLFAPGAVVPLNVRACNQVTSRMRIDSLRNSMISPETIFFLLRVSIFPFTETSPLAMTDFASPPLETRDSNFRIL
jgi:hypothetical protein